MAKESPLVCMYHAACNDGFAAAWVVHQWHKNHSSLEIEFIPVQYGQALDSDALIQVCKDKRLLIVDFSFPRKQLQVMAEYCSVIDIIDHHKTAAEDLAEPPIANNVFVEFDMDRSGCQMTWDHFFPNHTRPGFLTLIGDRDLWRLSANNRAFYEGLSMYPRTFEAWDKLQDHSTALEVLAKGQVVMEYKEAQIEFALAEYSASIMIANHKVPICNMHYPWASEAGHKLAQNAPFSCTFVVNRIGHLKMSLRSDNPLYDVGAIAKLYGGGGHPGAAGFNVQSLAHLHEKNKELGFLKTVDS